MNNDKLLIEYVQATYDMESLLFKLLSVSNKLEELRPQLDYDSLTDEQKVVVQTRVARVVSLAECIEGVYK